MNSKISLTSGIQSATIGLQKGGEKLKSEVKGIRIPEDMEKRIKAQAARSNRSDSNYIKYAVERQLVADEKAEIENIGKMIAAKASALGVDKYELFEEIKEQLT